jgi:hypothetical protein
MKIEYVIRSVRIGSCHAVASLLHSMQMRYAVSVPSCVQHRDGMSLLQHRRDGRQSRSFRAVYGEIE